MIVQDEFNSVSSTVDSPVVIPLFRWPLSDGMNIVYFLYYGQWPGFQSI